MERVLGGQMKTDNIEERDKLLRQLADLIRNDWSGIEFDGRAMKTWMLIALDGTIEDVRKLSEDILKWVKNWYGY